jgi:hypothetical protein
LIHGESGIYFVCEEDAGWNDQNHEVEKRTAGVGKNERRVMGEEKNKERNKDKKNEGTEHKAREKEGRRRKKERGYYKKK